MQSSVLLSLQVCISSFLFPYGLMCPLPNDAKLSEKKCNPVFSVENLIFRQWKETCEHIMQ